jgi:hypothetical protein
MDKQNTEARFDEWFIKKQAEGLVDIQLSINRKPGVTPEAVKAELLRMEQLIADGQILAEDQWPKPTTFLPQEAMDIVNNARLDILEWSDLAPALDFATKAHAGQTRKYTGERYIHHPIAVARLVASVTNDKAMIIAAILHDTVEDTDATLVEIEHLFGADVASLVESLTDVSTPQDGLRHMRKEIDRLHIAKASPRAKTIKLADLIDNSSSIIERDPKFAKVYIGEKKLLLEVLVEGDPTLFSEAQRIVREAEAKFNE